MAGEKSLIFEKSLVWARMQDQKLFTWMTPIKIDKLMQEKKKVYTISNTQKEVLITKCQYSEQATLYALKLQSGAKIICSEAIDFNIEKTWVPLKEINFYEKILEYNIMNKNFRESYAMSIEKKVNFRAYEIDTEDHTAIVNSFLIMLDQHV